MITIPSLKDVLPRIHLFDFSTAIIPLKSSGACTSSVFGLVLAILSSTDVLKGAVLRSFEDRDLSWGSCKMLDLEASLGDRRSYLLSHLIIRQLHENLAK